MNFFLGSSRERNMLERERPGEEEERGFVSSFRDSIQAELDWMQRSLFIASSFVLVEHAPLPGSVAETRYVQG